MMYNELGRWIFLLEMSVFGCYVKIPGCTSRHCFVVWGSSAVLLLESNRSILSNVAFQAISMRKSSIPVILGGFLGIIYIYTTVYIYIYIWDTSTPKKTSLDCNVVNPKKIPHPLEQPAGYPSSQAGAAGHNQLRIAQKHVAIYGSRCRVCFRANRLQTHLEHLFLRILACRRQLVRSRPIDGVLSLMFWWGPTTLVE